MDSAFLHSLLQTDKEMESFLLIEAARGKWEGEERIRVLKVGRILKVGRRGRELKGSSIKSGKSGKSIKSGKNNKSGKTSMGVVRVAY